MDLLTEKELPAGFEYPREFLRIVELKILDIEPWYLLQGKPLRDVLAGLAERYSDRKLIPFARRQDNDDVACWQSSSNREVYIIHDFASPGWEEHGKFPGFYEWFRRAVEDFIEFDC